MLNVKQERFIQNIVNGMSQRQAYKEAYGATYADKDIDNNAYKLFNKAEIQARYSELLGKLEDDSIMSAKERMKWLSNVVKEEEVYVSDKMKAIDILNKMDGQYKQENINVNMTYEDYLKKVTNDNEY